jgi:hypothetical protein
MEDFGFIIPSRCVENCHRRSLICCLKAIRNFYPNTKIVLIDDGSVPPLKSTTDKIVIEKSLSPGGAEFLPYYHWFHKKYFKKAMILHDSMIMHRRYGDISEIKDVKFLRNFTCHRLWDVKEKQTEYNIEHKIQTHDDLIKHLVNTYNTKRGFVKFFNEIYDKKDEWYGCFGAMTIMTLDFLEKLQKETKILDMISQVNDRRRRMALECFFSIACQYSHGKKPDSYTLYYDGKSRPRLYDCYFNKFYFSR